MRETEHITFMNRTFISMHDKIFKDIFFQNFHVHERDKNTFSTHGIFGVEFSLFFRRFFLFLTFKAQSH